MPQTNETQLLIYCEGESEKQYVSALARRLKLENHATVKNPASSSPMSLLQGAFKDFTESLTAADRKPVTEI